MKVLIADDEVYICSLIRHLIDWEGLGLTLVGTFGNGDEVMAYLERDQADILICDIEMPGMNGLALMEQLSREHPEIQLVVISGYRNFEYALSALKYGAVNYLLKPLDQKSLNDVLRAIVTKSQQNLTSERVLERASARLQFLDCITKMEMPGSLEEINQRYHFNFTNGLFDIIFVCFPGSRNEINQLPVVCRMFESILRPKLQELCHEFEIFHDSPAAMCVLLNYDAGDEKALKVLIDNILQSSIVEISCKTQKKCYLGVGTPQKSFSDIRRSYMQARIVMAQRLVNRNQRVFYADENTENDFTDQRLLTRQEKDGLQRIVEEINPSLVRGWVDALFSSRAQQLQAHPWLYIGCSVQAAWHLMVVTDKLDAEGGSQPAKLEEFIAVAESCETPEDLRMELSALIETEINQNLSSKLDNVAAYAQGAKQYIDKHYMENITLKSLASGLGINPSYLSVLFKNEMQMNYSEYLLSVRMEQAKKLLRQRDKNLSQIANAVGYDRVSYFGKLFRNYTGLKPSEYRRLHQHGLGD